MNPKLVPILAANIEHLPEKDRSFAKSLVDQHAAKGSLSEKQLLWVGRLVEKLLSPPEAAPAAPVENQIGDMAGVYSLFASAAQHLQKPKIALKTEGGKDIVLSIAGPSSKYQGQITVKSDGPYGSTNWYGVIDPNGQFKPSALGKTIKDDLTSVLTKLAANPALAASSFGKAVGKCCFCKKKLTTEESLSVGYGPDCASHFGLPWGNSAKSPTKLAA